MEKRGQAGVEYLIVVGFVTFSIMAVIVVAYVYTGLSKDQITLNQVENFALKLIDTSESVFFAGEPSQTEISLYLPEGVSEISINSKEIIITISTSSGINIRSFQSTVPLEGEVSNSPGIKVLTVRAESDKVIIG